MRSRAVFPGVLLTVAVVGLAMSGCSSATGSSSAPIPAPTRVHHRLRCNGRLLPGQVGDHRRGELLAHLREQLPGPHRRRAVLRRRTRSRMCWSSAARLLRNCRVSCRRAADHGAHHEPVLGVDHAPAADHRTRGHSTSLTGVSKGSFVSDRRRARPHRRRGHRRVRARAAPSTPRRWSLAAPDVLMTGGTDDPAYAQLRDAGIGVVANAEWLEATPLGPRRMDQGHGGADRYRRAGRRGLRRHPRGYLDVAAKAAAADPAPVLLGRMSQGTWYMSSGGSFMGRSSAMPAPVAVATTSPPRDPCPSTSNRCIAQASARADVAGRQQLDLHRRRTRRRRTLRQPRRCRNGRGMEREQGHEPNRR